MDIETTATSTVKLSISNTEFLSSRINEGDKEPSWDGHIYVYNNKSKKKNTLEGRVPVQVKGKISKDFSKTTISYPVEVTDLANYLKEGCIYFVVYISEDDNNNTKIYYASLLLVKIKMLLGEAKGEKTININFKEFPTDNTEKVNLFLNFLQDKIKQMSFINTDLLSLEEIEKKGILESIAISYTGYGLDQEKFQQILLSNEIYMYAKIKGSPIEQPLKTIPTNLTITQSINNNVYVGGKLFYEGCELIRSKDKNVLKIGQSYFIEMNPNDPSRCKMKFKVTGTLKNRIEDIDFIISAIETKVFKIGELDIPVLPKLDELEKFDLENVMEIFEFYKKAQKALDFLGVKKDLDIEKVKDEEVKNLARLIQAFVENEPVGGLKNDLPPVLKITIANLRFLLAFVKCPNKEGTYNIYDFFKTKFRWFYELEDGVKYPTSQYVILKKADFLEVSNINYDAICTSFYSVDGSERYYDQVNFCLLQMMAAYDEGGGQELLKTAKNIAKWLLEKDEALTYEIKILNYLQIIRRERNFEIDEIKQLWEIAEKECETRGDIIVAAYLLLGYQSIAESYFNKLELDLQNDFKQYPIYKFWQSTER